MHTLLKRSVGSGATGEVRAREHFFPLDLWFSACRISKTSPTAFEDIPPLQRRSGEKAQEVRAFAVKREGTEEMLGGVERNGKVLRKVLGGGE